MLSRSETIVIGVVAAAIASGIVYAAYQSSQNVMVLYFPPVEDKVSVFDIPQEIVNGMARPLYSDTAERKIVLLKEPEDLEREDISIGFPNFEFCRDAQAFENNPSDTLAIGEDDNPAVVKIGASEAAVVEFCAYNTKFNGTDPSSTSGLSYLQYLVIRKEFETDLSYASASVEGLGFVLSTRVIDPPPVKMLIQNGTISSMEVVKERIYLNVLAFEDAEPGVHIFWVMAMHPTSNTGGSFESVGTAVYVDVKK